MERFTLPRSGGGPLTFEGERLAAASSRANKGPAESRWYELSVYRTRGGRYVAAVGFRSSWTGEPSQDFARACDSAAEVREFLGRFDPCSPSLWTGVPPNVGNAEHRNQHIRGSISAAYDTAVSAVLAGDEFAEVIQ